MTAGRYPLHSLRVLDLSRVLAGPLCCQILADLGADVVKVERPGTGDDTRTWGPPFLQPHGPSTYYLACNRGKRSLALDLAHPAARTVLDELLGQADVLVENFLPHTAQRLGLDHQQLRQRYPRLVVTSISGYGRSSPQADLPGYDLVAQAVTGLMSITGQPDGPPLKLGVAISDILTGLYAAISTLAGLFATTRDRPGWHFDLALFDCTLASLINVAQATLVTGQCPQRYGNAHPSIVPYETLATADGHLVLAVGNDAQFARLAAELGQPQWAADTRFATNPARVAHRAELMPLVAAEFRLHPTDHWQRRLTAAQVPHAPVRTVDEALADPQTAVRHLVQHATDAAGRSIPLLATPLHWIDQPTEPPRFPPALGEHSGQVLRDWLDYDHARIATLRQQGAIA